MYSPREEERACALGKEGHLKGEGGSPRSRASRRLGEKEPGREAKAQKGLDLLLCAKRGQDKEGRASPAFLEGLRRERRGPRSGPASGGDRGAEAGRREAPKEEKDTPQG